MKEVEEGEEWGVLLFPSSEFEVDVSLLAGVPKSEGKCLSGF